MPQSNPYQNIMDWYDRNLAGDTSLSYEPSEEDLSKQRMADYEVEYQNILKKNPDRDKYVLEEGMNVLRESPVAPMNYPTVDDLEKFGKERIEKTQGGDFTRGMKRGWEQMQGLGYGAVGLAGSALEGMGAETVGKGLKDWGFEGYKRNMEEASKYYQARFSDDKIDWAQGQVGGVVPSMIEAAASSVLMALVGTAVAPGVGTAGGAVTGLFGRAVLRKAIDQSIKQSIKAYVKRGIAKETAEELAKKGMERQIANIGAKEVGKQALKSYGRTMGGKVGIVAGVAPLEAAGNWGEMMEKGIDNPVSAISTGLAAGFLELAGGNARLIESVLGKPARIAFTEAIDKGAVKQVAGFIRKAAGQAGEEAFQEAGQEVLSLANIAMNDPTFEAFTKENVARVAESAAVGGLVGGLGGMVPGRGPELLETVSRELEAGNMTVADIEAIKDQYPKIKSDLNDILAANVARTVERQVIPDAEGVARPIEQAGGPEGIDRGEEGRIRLRHDAEAGLVAGPGEAGQAEAAVGEVGPRSGAEYLEAVSGTPSEGPRPSIEVEPTQTPDMGPTALQRLRGAMYGKEGRFAPAPRSRGMVEDIASGIAPEEGPRPSVEKGLPTPEGMGVETPATPDIGVAKGERVEGKGEKPSIEPGDKVIFKPTNTRNLTVEGMVADVVKSDSGNVGYNILSPAPNDPGRVLRVWEEDGAVEVVSKGEKIERPQAAPVKETPKPEPKNRKTASVLDLVDDYKHRGMDRYRAWDQFVIDRDLEPDLDAKEFYGLFDKAIPKPFGETPSQPSIALTTRQREYENALQILAKNPESKTKQALVEQTRKRLVEAGGVVEGKPAAPQPMSKKAANSAYQMHLAIARIKEIASKDKSTGRFSDKRKHDADKAWETIRLHAHKLGIDIPERSRFYDSESDLANIKGLEGKLPPWEDAYKIRQGGVPAAKPKAIGRAVLNDKWKPIVASRKITKGKHAGKYEVTIIDIKGNEKKRISTRVQLTEEAEPLTREQKLAKVSQEAEAKNRERANTATSFRTWIKWAGGIQRKDKTWAGEIRDIVGRRGMKGMPPGIFKKSALGIDEMTLKAIDAGWLPKGSTEDDFIRALEMNPREKVSQTGSEEWIDKQYEKEIKLQADKERTAGESEDDIRRAIESGTSEEIKRAEAEIQRLEREINKGEDVSSALEEISEFFRKQKFDLTGDEPTVYEIGDRRQRDGEIDEPDADYVVRNKDNSYALPVDARYVEHYIKAVQNNSKDLPYEESLLKRITGFDAIGDVYRVDKDGNETLVTKPKGQTNLFEDKPRYSAREAYRQAQLPPDVQLGVNPKGLESIARRLKRAWANAPDVVVVEKQADLPQELQRKNRIISGAYYGGKVYLVAENMLSLGFARKTLAHEIVGHHGFKLVREDADTRARMDSFLERLYRDKQAEIDTIAERYEYDVKTDEGKLLAVEEWLARTSETNPRDTWVRRAVAIVRQWLAKRMPLLKVSNAEVAAWIGQMRRAVVEGKGEAVGINQFAQDAKYSLKEAASKIKGLAAFKKWFGDSKVVDQNGEPLVVYHGTPRKFNVFKKTKERDAGYYSEGFYLTKDPTYAELYTTSQVTKKLTKSSQVMPLYVSIKNPFNFDSPSGSDFERIWKAIDNIRREKGLEPNSAERKGDYKKAFFGAKGTMTTSAAFERSQLGITSRNILERAGYDGAFANNMEEIIAFHPTQIKSIYNTGTWDATNPDLRYQLAGERAIGAPTGQLATAQEMELTPPAEPATSEAMTEKGEGRIPTVSPEAEGGKFIQIFRGVSSHQQGDSYYTPNKEWARQFTQSGQDKEISSAYIKRDAIYRPSPLPKATSETEFDSAIAEAKERGFDAVWFDEGPGEPNSVYVIHKKALKSPTPKPSRSPSPGEQRYSMLTPEEYAQEQWKAYVEALPKDKQEAVREAIAKEATAYDKGDRGRLTEAWDAIKGIPAIRKTAHREAKSDFSVWQRVLSVPSHFFHKIPAMGRVFDHSNQRQDNYQMLTDDILKAGDKDYYTKRLDVLRKQDKAQYRKLQAYLKHRDQNKIGYSIAQNAETGQWELFGAKNKTKALATFEREGEALRAMVQAEGADYIKAGGTQQAAEALMGFRQATNNGFGILFQAMRDLMAYYAEKGQELPKEVVNVDGNAVEVDLRLALAKMGEMRGYYFPRIRRPGRYAVYAAKKGAHPVRQHFDVQLKAEAWASKMRNRGYEVGIEKQKKMPEAVFEMAGNIVAQEALINAAFKKLRTKKYTLDQFGLEAVDRKLGPGKRDFMVKGTINKDMRTLFKKMGGEWYESDPGGQKVWHFKNPGRDFERRLAKAIAFEDVAVDIDKEAHAMLGKALTEQLADIIKGRGSRAHMIARRDATGLEVWEGYEEDPGLALAKYARSVAAGEAKKIAARDMLSAFTGTDISWKQYKEMNEGEVDYEDYLKFVQERRVDPEEQPNAYKEGMSYIQQMLRNDEAIDRLTGALRGVAVLKYLGGRVSAPLVNLTALATSVPASMNGFGNIPIHKTFKYLAQASNYYKTYTFGDKNSLPDDVRILFDEIHEKGWSNAQFNREALAVLRGKAGRAWDKVIDYSMIGFGVTEKLNRVSTIAGSYLGLKAQGQTDHDAMMETAKRISDQAHATYGKANWPLLARGTHPAAHIMKALYVFKTFSHNYLLSMKDLWGDSWRPQHAKAFAYMAISPAILAGGGGIVGWQLIMSAIAKAFDLDDPEEELYGWLAQNMGNNAETFARFGLAGLAGMNIKGSLEIGVTDLPTSLGDLLGAPGSVIADLWEGGASILKGDVSKGLERISPLAVAGPIKAYREHTEGLTTRMNAPIFYGRQQAKADMADAVMRALSFNPAGIAKVREQKWAETQQEIKYKDLRSAIHSRIYRFMVKPIEERNKAEWADIIEDIREYNERVKRMKLAGIVPFITDKSIRANIKRNFRPTKKELVRRAANE